VVRKRKERQTRWRERFTLPGVGFTVFIFEFAMANRRE